MLVNLMRYCLTSKIVRTGSNQKQNYLKENIIGKTNKMKKFIVIDNVSGLANKSKNFARKFGNLDIAVYTFLIPFIQKKQIGE